MNGVHLPTVNAIFNFISAIFLVFGFIQIRKGNRTIHKKSMIGALISSTFFLIGYVIYHYSAGSVPYPSHDWTRPIYFIILIPHIILAAVMGPFVLTAVYFAIKNKFDLHKKITKWVWPVWMFVSISGIVIYSMLYLL